MVEETFKLKLSKKEAMLIDNGRFKGMLDMFSSIEKRIEKQKAEGKELDLKTLVAEFAIHKAKAKQLYNKSAKALMEFKDDDKAEEPVKEVKKPLF
jgi:hypothetical protein